MYLDKDTFKTVIDSTPLISIDFLVKNSKGNYLLGYRNNRPARGFWFVPGGRILKNETLANAFKRLCKNELGIEAIIQQAKLIGPFDHFYDDYVFGEGVSTHYVALGFLIDIDIDIDIDSLPNDQHNQYAWFSEEEVMVQEDVHKHSKWYLDSNAT